MVDLSIQLVHQSIYLHIQKIKTIFFVRPSAGAYHTARRVVVILACMHVNEDVKIYSTI